MTGGRIGGRFRNNANRIELTAQEISLIEITGLNEKDCFVDRNVGGKIIRYRGVLRFIETKSLATTPKGDKVIVSSGKRYLDVRETVETDQEPEPAPRPIKNHVWSA